MVISCLSSGWAAAITAGVLALLTACGGGGGGGANAVAADPAPAPAPSSPAPAASNPVAVQVRELTTGLSNPWGLAFLPDGRMLVTQRPGRLTLLGENGQSQGDVSGVPAVYAQDQGACWTWCSIRRLP